MQQIDYQIDPTRIYTPDEAAELFRVAPGTIRRLIVQGAINGFRVGVNLRMTGAALLEFMTTGGARVAYQPDDGAADPTKITNGGPALAESVAA